MRSLALIAAAALLAPACGGSGAASDAATTVVTAVYPLHYVVEEVAGGRAAVINLSPPGVEPHDLELTPGQVGELTDADLVVYLGRGFQPALEDALRDRDREGVLDALQNQALIAGPRGSDEGGADPHVWLDPVRLGQIASEVAGKLADVDPSHERTYRTNAQALQRALADLDKDYWEGLADCRSNEIVTAHEAFGYVAERYGLQQIGISGLDPEIEPSPRRVAAVADFAREHRVTTIFFEELLPRDLAETVAEEVGVETAVLDPLESRPENGDYMSGMRTNLEALRKALDCS